MHRSERTGAMTGESRLELRTLRRRLNDHLTTAAGVYPTRKSNSSHRAAMYLNAVRPPASNSAGHQDQSTQPEQDDRRRLRHGCQAATARRIESSPAIGDVGDQSLQI